MTNVALYARISRDDKKTPAVELQLANLRKLAVAEGYTVVREYSDDGISAYSGKTRPGFIELVKGIRNEEFSVVLAVAEDRLTRSSAEKIGLQSDSVKHGVTWHTLASGKVDPSTAEGGLLATITGALAEYESALKVERIKRSVADRLAAGKDLGGPRPFGYEVGRKEIRESEAELIRTGYEMILETKSLYAVAKMFDASGITRDRAPEGTWRTQTVRHILLRERNIGRLVVQGVEYSNELPRIIDDETFYQVKAILDSNVRPARRGPKPQTWTAIGTVRCGVCGSFLAQTGARENGARHIRCTPMGRAAGFEKVKHPTMEAKKLEMAISMGVFIKLITTRSAESIGTAATPLAELRARVHELERQRDVAQELAFAPGANLSTAKKKLATLGKSIEEAQHDLDAAMSGDIASAAIEQAKLAADEAMDEGRAWVELHEHEFATDEERWDAQDKSETGRVTRWIDHWEAMPIEDRRALVLALLPNARLLPGSRFSERRLIADGFKDSSYFR